MTKKLKLLSKKQFSIYNYYNKDLLNFISNALSRDSPSLIEFLSYIFNFQGIIVGPLCFYNDYIDFITGNNILKKRVIIIINIIT